MGVTDNSPRTVSANWRKSGATSNLVCLQIVGSVCRVTEFPQKRLGAAYPLACVHVYTLVTLPDAWVLPYGMEISMSLVHAFD